MLKIIWCNLFEFMIEEEIHFAHMLNDVSFGTFCDGKKSFHKIKVLVYNEITRGVHSTTFILRDTQKKPRIFMSKPFSPLQQHFFIIASLRWVNGKNMNSDEWSSAHVFYIFMRVNNLLPLRHPFLWHGNAI